MAAKFTSPAQFLRRLAASGIVQGNTNYTCTFWVRYTAPVAVGEYAAFFVQQNATQYAQAGSGTGATNARVDIYDGASFWFTANKTLYVNRYTPISYIRNGNNHSIYIYGVLVGTQTLNMSGVIFTEQMLGNDNISSDAQLEICFFREWNKVKTLAGLRAEWNSPTAIDTVDLYSDCPLLTDGNDISGNNRHYTNNGGVTFVASPTPVPDTNVSFATAKLISSLPFEAVQVCGVEGDSPTPPKRYYTYTTPPSELVHGFFGRVIIGNDPGTLTNENLSIYVGPVGSPTLAPLFFNQLGLTSPDQLVIAPSQEYFYEVTFSRSAREPYSHNFSIESPSDNVVPLGSLLINDDTANLPLIILSPTGTVLRFISPFPAGEQGDCLRISGRYLFQDLGASNIRYYENNLVLLNTLTIPIFSTQVAPKIRAQHTLGRWYVAELQSISPAKLTYIDSSGNISATSWNITNLNGTIISIAVSNDGNTLYYACFDDSIIRTHNLLTDTAGPNLVGALSGSQQIKDILVLTDDSIVALAVEDFGLGIARPTTVRRYDPLGVLQNTYNIGNNNTDSPPRMTYATDDLSFWVYLHTADGITPAAVYDSQFIQVRVSDGFILNQPRIASFDQTGSNQRTGTGIADLDTDVDRFGPSPSCPLVVAQTNGGGGGGIPVTNTITVNKVTVPSGDPQSFDFTTTGGLVPSTFSLVHGGSQIFSGLADGVYGVTETPVPDWDTSYNVSDGSPHEAISLAGGENIIVTVTNTKRPNVASGIYKIVPDKRQDTLWVDFDDNETRDVKIPNPFAKTALLGE